MDVGDEELTWIREGTPIGMALSSALPPGFAVYGVLDVEGDDPVEDHALLTALAPDPEEVLVAGALMRGGSGDDGAAGTDRVLYSGWHYRFRRLTAAEVHLCIDGQGLSTMQTAWRFPEILFPEDRRFLVSTLWDDDWRSIGADEATADRVEAVLPTFERTGRDVDLRTTGRNPY